MSGLYANQLLLNSNEGHMNENILKSNKKSHDFTFKWCSVLYIEF